MIKGRGSVIIYNYAAAFCLKIKCVNVLGGFLKKLVLSVITGFVSLALAGVIFIMGCLLYSKFQTKEMGAPMIAEPIVVESVSYDRYAYQQLDDE